MVEIDAEVPMPEASKMPEEENIHKSDDKAKDGQKKDATPKEKEQGKPENNIQRYAIYGLGGIALLLVAGGSFYYFNSLASQKLERHSAQVAQMQMEIQQNKQQANAKGSDPEEEIILKQMQQQMQRQRLQQQQQEYSEYSEYPAGDAAQERQATDIEESVDAESVDIDAAGMATQETQKAHTMLETADKSAYQTVSGSEQVSEQIVEKIEKLQRSQEKLAQILKSLGQRFDAVTVQLQEVRKEIQKNRKVIARTQQVATMKHKSVSKETDRKAKGGQIINTWKVQGIDLDVAVLVNTKNGSIRVVATGDSIDGAGTVTGIDVKNNKVLTDKGIIK